MVLLARCFFQILVIVSHLRWALSGRRWRPIAVTVAGATALAIYWHSPKPVEAQIKAQAPGNAIVLGSFHAKTEKALIAVPDLTVQVRDLSTGVTRATTRTDLTGHFHTTKQPAGRYQICWAGAGYVAGCGPSVSLSGETAWAGDIVISPEAPYVYGNIKLKDGTPCYGADASFGINLYTRIYALSSAGSMLVPPVRANSQGDYIVGALPNVTSPQLKVVCEGLTTARTFAIGQGPVNIGLANARPKIDDVNAFVSGQGVREAAVSGAVDIRAQASDPNGDALHFRWRPEGGAGAVDLVDNVQTTWKLPAKPGRYTVHVVAYDGKGGYASGRVTLSAGGNGAEFSGRVVDGFTGSPIGKAVVSVGGVVKTLTDAKGNFYLRRVPYARRYVLSITRDGYAPLSRIYDKSALGGVYRMETAQQTLQDPKAPINVADTRKELERRKTRGVRLIMDPGTLDTTNPVITSLSTMDPSYRPMPGDYRAIDAGGKDQSLISYGAVFASFQDSVTGAKANIAPGKKATVEFPVASGQASVAPPTIALWSYDETTGVWREEGQATLQSRPEGLVYVGTTTHFSYINTDVAQGSAATCLRVRVDPLLLPAGLTLRVHIPTAPSYKQLQETPLDGDQFHAIYRLPKNDTVTLELIDSNSNVIPGATQVIDLSLRPPMVGTNMWPPYPYTECGEPVVMGITMPPYGELSQGKPYFLTGPYGAINTPSGVDPVEMTKAYYKAIGALDMTGVTGPKDTLGKWWGANGFNATTGAGGTRAAYINHNELGFGRDAHCAVTVTGSTTFNVGCYVTNYGFADQNPGNGDQALAADTTNAVTTVAMEYVGSSGVVKFYAYQGGDKDGPIIFDAALDAFGPKPIPQVCTVCHGGNYYPVDPLDPQPDEINMGAKFRDFDVASFKFPPGGLDVPVMPDGFGSYNDFRTLNDMVKATVPSTSAMWQIIDTWYATGASTPDTITPINGWNASPQDELYRQVHAKSCRGCHAARDGALEFKTFSDFKTMHDAINGAVCGDTKTMPNAVVTYKNFWQSVPSRPGYLSTFAATGWTAFGACD